MSDTLHLSLIRREVLNRQVTRDNVVVKIHRSSAQMNDVFMPCKHKFCKMLLSGYLLTGFCYMELPTNFANRSRSFDSTRRECSRNHCCISTTTKLGYYCIISGNLQSTPFQQKWGMLCWWQGRAKHDLCVCIASWSLMTRRMHS